jgi:hypothetical protein
MAVGAIMGKEMGVSLPLALLLTDLFFFTPPERAREPVYWRRRIVPHLPFLALVAAYALMRFYLIRTGIVTNTYSGPSLLSWQGVLDATAGNVLLLLGIWGGPTLMSGLPNAAKVVILLLALALAVLLVRRYGRPALYCLLWVALTLLPTFNLSALRWMYIPSFGVCLLGALMLSPLWAVHERPLQRAAPLPANGNAARPTARRAGYALLGLAVLVWGLGVLYQNVLWHRAGEEARSILAQIHSLVPDTSGPATIYFAGAPSRYDTVLLFNSGLSASMGYLFEGRQVELHEVEQPLPDPVIRDAQANPPRFRPNALFMGYKAGKVYAYPTWQDLLAAGVVGKD